MPFAVSLPPGRRVLLLDAALALWAAAWIAMGVAVASSVDDLVVLPDAFTSVGGAIESSGRALGALELPVVGTPLRRPGAEIAAAGREVTARGRASRGEVEAASDLLGVAVALIPTLPLLLLYLPPRIGRELEAQALRRTLADGAGDPALERLLAERAAVSVSYRRLRQLGARPWRDLAEGRHRALAAEELRRLGVDEARLGRPRAG